MSEHDGVAALRRMARRGTLDPVARDVLDRLEPGWNQPQFELRWTRKLALFARWCQEHERLPRQRGTDRDRDEREAGDWLRTQKQDRNLSTERRARLDQAWPGWDRATMTQWQKSLDETATWVVEHRRLPRVASEDPVERRHGVWLRTWRTTLGRKPDPERLAALDRAIPGWSRGRRDVFRGMAEAYATWATEHQALPAVRHGADAEERRLAAWANSARTRHLRGKLSDEARQCLDQLVPGWQLTLTERRALWSQA